MQKALQYDVNRAVKACTLDCKSLLITHQLHVNSVPDDDLKALNAQNIPSVLSISRFYFVKEKELI